MKIALVFPPAWAINYPPIGLTSIAQTLRQAGEEVTVYDFNIELWHVLHEKHQGAWTRDHRLYWDPSYGAPAWKSDYWEERAFEREILPDTSAFFREKIAQLAKGNFDAIGFSIFEPNCGAARHFVRAIRAKQPQVKLFVGGPSVGELIQSKTLHVWFPDLDAAVVGEGELPVQELVRSWREGTNPAGKPGIVARDAVGQLIEPKTTRPAVLADLPGASFDDYDLSRYLKPVLPISAGRGCVNSCSFCSECRTWKPFRTVPAARIVEDIEFCVRKYWVREFLLIASVFNGDHRHVREVCEGILRRGLKVFWSCNARLDEKLDGDLIELMAKAGCVCMVFGLESASDSVLELMRKNSTAEIALRILKDCHRVGIKASMNLVVGFPGESEADFEKTLDFVKKHSIYMDALNVTKCTLSRGSTIHDHPARYGIISDEKGALAVSEDGGQLRSFRHDWQYITDWATTDGLNTPSVRQYRHDALVALADRIQKRGNTPFDQKGSHRKTRGKAVPWQP